MIIGVTGHSSLSDASVEPIYAALQDALRPHVAAGNLIGITCLARGADQVFARAVLDLGGEIEVVLPAADYGEIPDPDSRARFAKFIADASAVHTMPFAVSGPEAYLAASKDVVRRCDLLVAIWDGGPADGKGGTADAVQYAKSRHRDIEVVWPPTALRM